MDILRCVYAGHSLWYHPEEEQILQAVVAYIRETRVILIQPYFISICFYNTKVFVQYSTVFATVIIAEL